MKLSPKVNLVLTVLFYFMMPLRTHAQFSQQGNKLVGTGAVGAARQGSVALSADGNTAVVGGGGDNTNAGAVWVYTRSGGLWTQQGSKLVGTGAVNGSSGAEQGQSVSLSADGNTAVVGGAFDNSGAGAVWVYTRSGGVWTQQGSKLAAVGGASQGNSVALSSDGNTAVVGGYLDNGGAGAAWVYTRPAVWIQPNITRKIRASIFTFENKPSLSFDLPKRTRVVIQIFNAQGRIVSQLLDETREAGSYTLPLSRLQNSYSILDFRAGDFHETIKIEP